MWHVLAVSTNAAYSGVAKAAKVIAVKVLGDNGCVPCIYFFEIYPSNPNISKVWYLG